MGYWNTDSEGRSFAEGQDPEMVWGDAPADIMDEALKRIIQKFRQDLGRSPSLDELKAGLLFSAQVALESEREEREAKKLKAFEVHSEWRWKDSQYGRKWNPFSEFIDATDAEHAKRIWEEGKEDLHLMENRIVQIDELEEVED